jgi:peptide deformylase
MNLEGEPGQGEEMVFINPVIKHPKGTEEREEGCLSLPELYAPVVRPKRVQIQAYGLDGNLLNADVDGMFARCVQHELDHLDGVLFVDRVNPALAPQLRPALDEMETEFHSRRSTGGIPSDAEILARLGVWEKKYCLAAT